MEAFTYGHTNLECARSRLISEAKQGPAWLVLGWDIPGQLLHFVLLNTSPDIFTCINKVSWVEAFTYGHTNLNTPDLV